MLPVKVLSGKPPIFPRVLELLGPEAWQAFFAWGDTIYVPAGRALPEEILLHELVHLERQAGDPETWWEHWLTDTAFRLDEEARGYGAQLAWIRERLRSGKHRHLVATRIAAMLSGPLYGELADHNAAARLLAKYSKRPPRAAVGPRRQPQPARPAGVLERVVEGPPVRTTRST